MKRSNDVVISAKCVAITRRSKRLQSISTKVDANTESRAVIKKQATNASNLLSPEQRSIPTPEISLSPDEPKIKVEFENFSLTLTTTVKTEAEVSPNVFPFYLKDLKPNQPSNWIKIYNNIVRMRMLIETPVDSMGCGKMPTSLSNNRKVLDRKIYRFQLLVALMLSSQTKDEVNFAAVTTLHEHYQASGYLGLCLDAMLALTEEEIDKCIAKVGFHKKKALYLKRTCDLLREKFDSDIPKTIDDVVSLPGVGLKMGHLLLQNGWGINLGIGVDVHIHRLAQMWGWVPKSDTPDVTRLAMEEWLPRECWADINPLLVGFGQSVCAIKANNCDICTLSNGLCKSSNKKLAKTPLTEKRIEKLMLMRGNLDGLIKLRAEKDLAKSEVN